ncbi:PaaI family thioesterase [Tsuneonella mangrovi]|uniref:PaaI family thioesterase n=1 Tax=Tsuneonella mangrovi TaxID=1982042 RepID=UPI0014724C0D|nr:PaaI family thioesterase [Tsuneonella mangrovi]
MSAFQPPEGFKPARFSPGFLDHGGPYWLKSEGDHTLVGLRIEQHHINYQDAAHGGVLTTFADVALSFQAFNSSKPPLPTVTIALTTHFVGPARLGDWIVADARIDRIGNRTAYASGRIVRGQDLLATMTGVFSVLRR